MRTKIEEAITKLNKLEAPENFYTPQYWDFGNSLGASEPSFESRYRSTEVNATETRIREKSRQEINKVNQMAQDEQEKLRQLSNDLYHQGSSSSDSLSSQGGFKIPVLDLKNRYFYKNINDKQEVNNFFKSLEGIHLSDEDLKAKFAEELKVFAAGVDDYPESEKILARWQELRDSFEKNYRYKSELVDVKMNTKKDLNYRQREHKESYIVKEELFSLNKNI